MTEYKAMPQYRVCIEKYTYLKIANVIILAVCLEQGTDVALTKSLRPKCYLLTLLTTCLTLKCLILKCLNYTQCVVLKGIEV